MNQLFNYIAIIIFIFLIAVMALLYLRHRLITRYRDIKAVARDHNVSPQKVVVNSTTLTDGILVRIEDRDYRVNLSQTGDNYTLTRAHVVNHQVNLMK